MRAPNVPQNALQILVNEPQRLAFGPYEIEITPLTIGELPAVLRALGPLVQALAFVQGPEDAIALLGDHGDAVLEAAALAARLPLEQVQALPVDAAAELVLGLVEVNADFFGGRMQALSARGRALKARIEAAAASSAPATATTGPTSSPAS